MDLDSAPEVPYPGHFTFSRFAAGSGKEPRRPPPYPETGDDYPCSGSGSLPGNDKPHWAIEVIGFGAGPIVHQTQGKLRCQ